MLPPIFLVVPVAWLAGLVLVTLQTFTPQIAGELGLTPRPLPWTVLIVQALATLAFVTPLWRLVWRVVPPLNRWVFPDLNGDWEVEGETNWNRIDSLLKAAKGDAAAVDMRQGDEATLPPLGQFKMQARISQSWLKMDIELWNPSGAGPIQESHTLVVQPFRGKAGRHGLTYVFEQVNTGGSVSDDKVFRGAAWVVCERDSCEVLCGTMWSDRMWQRGMNTAARIRFGRLAKKQNPVP